MFGYWSIYIHILVSNNCNTIIYSTWTLLVLILSGGLTEVKWATYCLVYAVYAAETVYKRIVLKLLDHILITLSYATLNLLSQINT